MERRRRTKWERIKFYIYNPESNKCCTRTPLNWLSVLTFYLISILVLFALHVVLTYFTLEMLHERDDPWASKENILEYPFPEMSIVPSPGTLHSPLIWFKKANVTKGYLTPSYYQGKVKRFFVTYEEAEKDAQSYSQCPENKRKGKPCLFKKSDLGECADFEFGNANNDMCIYIKLGNVPNWVPRSPTERDKFPRAVSSDIRSKMYGGDPEEKSLIWLICVGYESFNKDHMGEITYFPKQGFPAYYYPYLADEKNYLRPLVAVKIASIKMGVLIFVKCSIYNANINFENPRRYNIMFALYVED